MVQYTIFSCSLFFRACSRIAFTRCIMIIHVSLHIQRTPLDLSVSKSSGHAQRLICSYLALFD